MKRLRIEIMDLFFGDGGQRVNFGDNDRARHVECCQLRAANRSSESDLAFVGACNFNVPQTVAKRSIQIGPRLIEFRPCLNEGHHERLG